jgi:hypothetical protein
LFNGWGDEVDMKSETPLPFIKSKRKEKICLNVSVMEMKSYVKHADSSTQVGEAT